MKYGAKYPLARPVPGIGPGYDSPSRDEPCLVLSAAQGPCCVCGDETPWLDVCFECWLCSDECSKTLNERVAADLLKHQISTGPVAASPPKWKRPD